ncbi:hypothetical protein [Actinoplanes couchii]|uniref:Uncharacterized protein n=1 Tax=Actinoplanes couchii TaxID=403638 RepID=A0ABQ3XNI6_9ACTN|nr:hypothetical protein [Actinoplanes couchii]MDR6318048.1 hypothetical protein [Actinoplanes couchii]GID60035.1 hypothetical protein Aco03nite_084390 [Actinoplanes couchii]
MKLLDVRNDLATSHRTLRVGELTLMSTRWPDGSMTIEVGRQHEDGSWSWDVNEPDFRSADEG